MFERLGRDVRRYFSLDSRTGYPSLAERIDIVLNAPQLAAIAVFRFGAWTQRQRLSPAVRLPLRLIYRALEKVTHTFSGVHIDDTADIGGGLYIGHAGFVLIGPVRMGEDCNVSINVTIGRRADSRGSGGTPTFGDRVWIGCGSVVFGGINIGTGASIAPLTCVGRSVGPRSLVCGSPMQILAREFDNTAQIYGRNPILTVDWLDAPR